jgi:hypothetical protein
MEVSELTSLDMFTPANPSSSCLCCTLSGAPFYTTYTCADAGLVAVGAIEAQVLLPGSTIGSCISRYCSSTGHCCKVWDAKSRFRQRIRWIPQRAAVSWSTLFQSCASCSFTREADGIPLAKFLLISLYKRRKKNGARSSMAQTLALLLFCNQISCMSTLCILPGWKHCSNP